MNKKIAIVVIVGCLVVAVGAAFVGLREDPLPPDVRETLANRDQPEPKSTSPKAREAAVSSVQEDDALPSDAEDVAVEASTTSQSKPKRKASRQRRSRASMEDEDQEQDDVSPNRPKSKKRKRAQRES